MTLMKFVKKHWYIFLYQIGGYTIGISALPSLAGMGLKGTIISFLIGGFTGAGILCTFIMFHLWKEILKTQDKIDEIEAKLEAQNETE